MTTENGVYTAVDLCDKIIPPMRWIAKDFMGEGTTLLSARPKAGKSLLALQLGIAVATGGLFLGRYQTVKGAVLYVNVDDPSQRRLQANLHLLGGRVDGLSFMSALPELDNGGLEILDRELARMAAIDPCRLLILDTLTALRKEQSGKNLIKSDYDFIGGIKRLMSKHGCSVLLISHSRKDSTSKEKVDNIDSHLGTTGLTAAVDASMLLTGANDTKKILKAKGRDISPFEVHLELQAEDRSGWLVVDAPVEPERKLGALRQRILDAVRAIGPCGPDAVSKETGINLNTVRSDMPRMAKAGQLFKDANALYSAAEEHTPSVLVALPALSALPASPSNATNAVMHLMHPTQPALPAAAQKEDQVNPTMSKNIVNLKGQEFNLETQGDEFLVKAFNITPYQAKFVLAGVGGDYLDKVVSSLRESWKLIKKAPDKPACMRGIVEKVAPVLVDEWDQAGREAKPCVHEDTASRIMRETQERQAPFLAKLAADMEQAELEKSAAVLEEPAIAPPAQEAIQEPAAAPADNTGTLPDRLVRNIRANPGVHDIESLMIACDRNDYKAVSRALTKLVQQNIICNIDGKFWTVEDAIKRVDSLPVNQPPATQKPAAVVEAAATPGLAPQASLESPELAEQRARAKILEVLSYGGWVSRSELFDAVIDGKYSREKQQAAISAINYLVSTKRVIEDGASTPSYLLVEEGKEVFA